MKNKTVSLITKNKTLLIAAAVFLVLGIFLGRKLNFSTPSILEVHADMTARNEDEAHGQDEHSTGEDAPQIPSDLEKMMCEHGIGIVDCDNCRFEAGVVKLDPSLAASLIEKGFAGDIDRTTKLKLTGQMQLDRTKAVDVVSTGGGRVERLEKLLGEKVREGDILAVIHSADLGQAKADFLEVQAELELAQATFKREQGLYEKKITSQAEYQNALNELKTIQASYSAADKKLQLFGLTAEQIAGIKDEKENGEFAYLVLRAPQGGTIITQNISVGKMADTTETLYTIADLSNVWVWCDVYEKDLAILHKQFVHDKSLQAMVRVKAFDSITFEGVVDFVGNVMDEHTRTVKMRVQVKNTEEKLRPGMFADVEVAIPLAERTLAVPQTAVMSDAGKHFVFQQWKNDLWIRRDVVTGKKYSEFIEIISGIPHGATIVTGGAFMLKSDVLREKMGAGCAD
ncbi:MAG: efflux RND transporter periplasmic adaptor subunit [Planctomycetales bacterium]|nr:efflux RND transporter periplasmic adaptor subunit [Planctomycetales bacterium]